MPVDNPITTRFLSPIDCSKIPALYFASYIGNLEWTRRKVIHEVTKIVCFLYTGNAAMFLSYTRKTLHLTVYFSGFSLFFSTEQSGWEGGTYSSYSIIYHGEER